MAFRTKCVGLYRCGFVQTQLTANVIRSRRTATTLIDPRASRRCRKRTVISRARLVDARTPHVGIRPEHVRVFETNQIATIASNVRQVDPGTGLSGTRLSLVSWARRVTA